jgi:predicted membrane GTPase involved in stress response
MDDDVVNRFARELADAIAAAVAGNPEVEACRQRARDEGYEMKVTLEAIVGFVERGGATAEPDEASEVDSPAKVAASVRQAAPRRAYDMTANDRRFLRSLRIAAEEGKPEDAN